MSDLASFLEGLAIYSFVFVLLGAAVLTLGYFIILIEAAGIPILHEPGREKPKRKRTDDIMARYVAEKDRNNVE